MLMSAFLVWTLQNLLSGLQHTGLKGSIEPLLEEADIDRDGKISLSEFQRLLRTASLGSRTTEYSARDHRHSH
jgi:calcium-dependent protein kinase